MNDSAREAAEAYGLDLSLTEENLRLSYDERLLQHQRALENLEALAQAGENVRSKPTPSNLSEEQD